jgi:hypothetical protein
MSPLTLDGSLASSVVGGRRYRTTRKKLQLIQDELFKRNIQLHEPNWKDSATPTVAGWAGLGGGFFISDLAMEATNTCTMSAHT